MRTERTHSTDTDVTTIGGGELLVYVERVDRERHSGELECQAQFLIAREDPDAIVLIESCSRNS